MQGNTLLPTLRQAVLGGASFRPSYWLATALRRCWLPRYHLIRLGRFCAFAKECLGVQVWGCSEAGQPSATMYQPINGPRPRRVGEYAAVLQFRPFERAIRP